MDVILALLPILVVLFLLIFRRMAADSAGLIGWGLILLIAVLFFNTPLFFDLTFNRWALPLAVIPNAPEKLRLFWQAYFWILVSTLLALPFLRTDRRQLSISLKKWLKRPRVPCSPRRSSSLSPMCSTIPAKGWTGSLLTRRITWSA